jgi:hypothetical protein
MGFFIGNYGKKKYAEDAVLLGFHVQLLQKPRANLLDRDSQKYF